MLTCLSVLALLPVMQIHLFETASGRSMTREVGKHNLALCMVAMDELRKVYLAADAAYKLFDAAMQKLNNQHQNCRPNEESEMGHASDAPRNDVSIFDFTSDLWTPYMTAFGAEGGDNYTG